MPTPRSEPLTREAIVAATRQLLVEDGMEALTLRRVARMLDVTAPALYAHVTDKRDLLRAVAEGEFASLIERFDHVPDTDALARVRALCRSYVDHSRANPELFRVMFLFPPELPTGSGSGTGQELPLATRAFSVPAAATAQAVNDGPFGGLDPLMAALTSWACVHGVATVLQLGFAFGPDTEEALITMVIDTVVAGLTHQGDQP